MWFLCFNIRGVEPVNFRELLVFILRWPIWDVEFLHELHMFGIVLLVHCGFRRASVKTASMSKQRKLPTYWCVLAGNKRIMGSSHECSLCGYCKAWSTCEAVTQTSCGCTLGSCVSACTPLTTAPEVVSRQSCDPIYSDKGRNGSHSIICKVTCCLLSLFLLHILFVFKCFRQSKNKCKSKDAVKNELLGVPGSIRIKHSGKQNPMYLTFFF